MRIAVPGCSDSLAAGVAGAASAAPFAYVPNEGSGTRIGDRYRDRSRRTTTIRTGGKPRGIAVAPDGKRLYVSDQTAQRRSSSSISRATPKPARVKLGDSPEGIYVSPDGRWLAAAIEENNQVADRRYGERCRSPSASR